MTAALLLKAVGPQLACIFVDNGLLRQGESEAVRRTFKGHFQADLHVAEAGERFLKALEDISDPQEKRRRIGHVFIDVFKDEARRIVDVKYLAQGTLYPDVIESGGSVDGPAHNIKTHHNVGGLPKELGFELIEPLKDLFKDEVRRLGLELGLPETASISSSVPLPRSGSALPWSHQCRAAESVASRRRHFARRIKTVRMVSADVASVRGAVADPVGGWIMGDGRTYGNVIAVRAVQTDDFMTADWSRLPYDLLAKISTRIINQVAGVNRVVYDVSSKPPATIEWE